MKTLRFWAVVLMGLLLAACGSDDNGDSGERVLKVTDGSTTKSYTLEDLEALPATEATFGEIAYVGVQLAVLVEDAGFDPGGLRAIKATATDGFSVNYEPALFTRQDTLVAYKQTDGPLNDDDKPFRMVLPAQEGRLNPRHLTEIRVIK